MASLTETELARIISLPSKIGQYLGEQVYGDPYVVYPWVEYMEQRIIEAVMDSTHERYIMIAAPPQTGKSTYVANLLPFWLTGMFPRKQVMYIGYSDDFATIRGKEVQDLHNDYGYLFGSAVDKRFQAGSDWRMKGARGGMLSVGVGGGITGRPGHFIVIDDLIKKGEEAASQSTLAKHVDEWDRTISTRLQPGGTVILMATRWAEGDLQGVLKERMATPGYDGPQWEMLEFPAFAEPPEDVELTEDELASWHDIIGREFGEVLDCRFSRIEGRRPEEFFELKRSATDKYAWAAMYQQHPSVREGGMFPKTAWVTRPMAQWPSMVEMVRVWDLAVTEGAGDFTVGTKVGKGSDGDFYIMNVQRFRRAAGEVEQAVVLWAELDGYQTRIMIEEEKGGCLVGDTEVRLWRNKSTKIKLSDLYRRFHGLDTRYAWDLSIPTQLGRADDGVVRLGDLKDVVFTGVKDCWKVTAEGGREIIGSAEHPVLTETGAWVGLADLLPGDRVAVRGQQGRGLPRQPKLYDTKVYGMSHHPYYHRAKSIGREGNGYYVVEHRLMAEATINGLDYAEYRLAVRRGDLEGLTFLDPARFDVHHVNHDHYDNRQENLEVVERSAHRRGHTDPNARMFRIEYVQVTSLTHVGERETYDVVMADDPHNFIANDFVVHNSGRTVVEFFKRLLPNRRVDAAKAEGDKVSRATPYSAQQNQGRVVLPPPDEVEWSVRDFVEEHGKLMPDGRGPRNDDQIDTGAYAVASLIDAGTVDIWTPAQGLGGLSPERQMALLEARPVVSGTRFASPPAGELVGVRPGLEDDEPAVAWPWMQPA